LIRARIWPGAKDHPRRLAGTGFVLTFVSVAVAMVMFRAPTVGSAASIRGDLAGAHGVTLAEGLLARLGFAAHWLHALGVQLDTSSGSQMLEGLGPGLT
jgi:hypothetical protein